jgi:hypothetical protein
MQCEESNTRDSCKPEMCAVTPTAAHPHHIVIVETSLIYGRDIHPQLKVLVRMTRLVHSPAPVLPSSAPAAAASTLLRKPIRPHSRHSAAYTQRVIT